MTTFIFFHGVAINTTNMLSGTIARMLADTPEPNRYKDNQCWLKITTANNCENHALDVDYDTARDEWARVWVDITTTGALSKPCARGLREPFITEEMWKAWRQPQ